MIIFLSALENGGRFNYINDRIDQYHYNLMSYFYITKNVKYYEKIIEKTKLAVIDSGAHSFQEGQKVDWLEYTKEYANWIYENDRDNILGYFEMDIDPAGYPLEFVEYLRSILQSKSDKIIKVWHMNRGIEEFKEMVKNPENSMRLVAITGYQNVDIREEQYINFVKYADAHDVQLFALGMTRKKLMDTVPFDYVDSSSWKQGPIYGKVRGEKVTKEHSKKKDSLAEMLYHSYLEGMEMQVHYRAKWLNHFTQKQERINEQRKKSKISKK